MSTEEATSRNFNVDNGILVEESEDDVRETTSLLPNGSNRNGKLSNNANYKSFKQPNSQQQQQQQRQSSFYKQQRQQQQQEQQYIYSQLINVMNDRRSKLKQNAAITILLIVNALERFAFYGLVANFLLYLNKQPLFWESYNAQLMLLIFFGISYISSLVGGWVADSLIGKYLTICLSFGIYIVGYVTFPLISYDTNKIPNICAYKANASNDMLSYSDLNTFYKNINVNLNILGQSDRDVFDETCSWIIILASLLIAIAVGFIKANLGPFGADQVISRGQSMVFKYFNWLYWCINLGSLLSLIILAYIQQNFSFFVGYIIPLVALVSCFILFLCGNFCYLKTESEVSIITNIFRVIYEAFKSVKRREVNKRQRLREQALLRDDDDELLTDSRASSVTFNDSYEFNSLSTKNISWLDNAKIRYGGSFDDNQVDDVKSLKAILILFALLIPYWMIYFQIETTYVIQGLHMKLFSESKHIPSFMIPAAWLSIADQVTVLVLIPLMDSIIYPYFNRKFKKPICINSRLVFGMSLSAMSVIAAGLLETIRIQIIQENPSKNTVQQLIDNTTFIAADLHILWQIPQYALIGFGEVFCSVCCVYYAYSASPKSMQSILMGLFYFFTGTGSFMGTISLTLFKKFIYSSKDVDNINCSNCHLNYYFYFLALLQIIGVLLFILIDMKCSIVKCNLDKSNNLYDPFLTLNKDAILVEDQNDEAVNEVSNEYVTNNFSANKNINDT